MCAIRETLRTLTAGVVLSAFAFVAYSHADCGNDPRELSDVLAASDAVFVGYVSQVSSVETAPKHRRRPPASATVVELVVNRAWKGMPDDHAEVVIGAETETHPELVVGRNYIFWAKRGHDGRLRLAACSRSFDIEGELGRADSRWLDSRFMGPAPDHDPNLKTYSMANGALANRKYAEAARGFESLVGEKNFPFRQDCQVNLGIAYLNLQRFPDAIAILRQAMNEPLGINGVWNVWAARSRRATAQWTLAVSLIGGGEYDQALQAIDNSATKVPIQTMCGNGDAQQAYNRAIYRGIAQEYLGRYAAAVQSYVEASRIDLFSDPTAAIRLADLYESAGQWDELKAFAMRLDAGYPTTLRRLIEIRDMERAGDFDSLVRMLSRRRNMLGSPWESAVRQVEWEAAQAAMLLARHPEASVPLLSRELRNGGDKDFVVFALGLCATEDAIELLRAAATKVPASNYAMELVHALTLAGPAGSEVLDELEASHAEAARYRTFPFPKHWFLVEGIEFPPLPKDQHLDPAVWTNPAR